LAWEFRGPEEGSGSRLSGTSNQADAKREATRDGAPAIDLIDGEQLCVLLKPFKLGVETEMVEKAIVHASWFDNLRFCDAFLSAMFGTRALWDLCGREEQKSIVGTIKSPLRKSEAVFQPEPCKIRRYAKILNFAHSARHLVFQRFRLRKTRARKPFFYEEFCEAAARHKIASQPARGKPFCSLWSSLSSNPPCATFLFLSAAQA
jgi:hypothetical protein